MATTVTTSDTFTAGGLSTSVKSKYVRVTLGTLTNSETVHPGITIPAGATPLTFTMTVVQPSTAGATTTLAFDDGSSGTLLAASSVASTVTAGTQYFGAGTLLMSGALQADCVVHCDTVANATATDDTIVDLEVTYLAPAGIGE